MTLFIRTASAVAILWAFAMAAEPPEPESLTQLRSAYLDKQADALKPVQQWYLEGLERLERALVQRGDVPGAAKVREERTTVEQPALVIVKAFWGTKEATTDITRRLQGFVRGNKLDIIANDNIAETDPVPGAKKQAIITFRRGDKERTVTIKQFDRISLP